MALFIRWIHVCLPFVALTGVCGYLLADEPLDVDRYVEIVHISLIVELEARLKELRVATEQANLLDADLPPAATKSVDLARFSYQKGETSLLTSKRTERARNTPGF